MMHEPEKSVPFIVAAKPANKSEQSEAESGEPREGAKGNTSEPHTHLTRSRDSVSTGLERVRERAKANKKERFTALLHHVTVGLLRTAYLKLKRDAAPIGRYPRGVSSSRKKMDDNGRLGSRRWRTKLSSVPWWRYSMRSMSKTFSAFRTGFDRGVASMMRWTHSNSGLSARR